jgi:quercetin 2,3-dioxygenase
MITLRRSSGRGKTKLNRLDSRHTFSFGDYYDPQHMVFRELRVVNEDRVNPGAGFPTHSHRHMEIITYTVAQKRAGVVTLGDDSTSVC